MKLFHRLLGSRPAAPDIDMPPAAPDQTSCVIGDVHGRIDLLETLINIHLQNRPPDAQIILVGDYVDRGDHSAQVLNYLYDQAQTPDPFICLLGNHEEMMLRFLDAPERHGSRWLRYGGLQTLASFGIGGVGETSSPDQLRQAAQSLQAALPSGLEAWLRALPRHWTSGNLHVVHAGADPQTPMTFQNPDTLIWGHPDFATIPRQDGQWVAYGHTVTDTPGSDGQGRIAVDTGAYYTGVLTAALIMPNGDTSLVQT